MINQTTKMQKIFEVYAQRQGIDAGNITAMNFKFHGKAVRPDDTAASLGLQENDIIEFLNDTIEDIPIIICVQNNRGGQDILFKVNQTTKMLKVFKAYAQRQGIDAGNSTAMNFKFHGKEVRPDDMAASLGLQENDIITCSLSPTYISSLPDSILRFIGEYLPNSSRAMMASALSRPACFDSDTLDFSDIGRDFASKLTDRDVRDILVSIDAVNRLKVLKLIGCENISGVGLEPMRGSTTIQQIDLSTSEKTCDVASSAEFFSPNFPWCFALSENAVIPVLDSINGKHDRSLRHVQCPLFWRERKSKLLTSFMERYDRALNSRTCVCAVCSDGFQGSPWIDITKGNAAWGLQNYTCYDCTKYFCDDCVKPFCKQCQKMFCQDCCTINHCDDCGKVACSECEEFPKCEACEESYCPDCMPVFTCECCNRTRCIDCSPHYTCSGCDNVSNCDDCAHAQNVQWCEVCYEDNCNDCRFKAYKEGELECVGCRSLLLPRIMQENESMLREKESLREKLDAIESGTMMRFSEADIEFVMNRADCSREDAIKAIKKFSCSYPHLSIAIRWLNLPNKERMASMYPVE